jgi:hypothetical protein
MSKIVSRNAARALKNGTSYSNGKNTKVDSTGIYLHGNHIARNAGEGHVAITNSGWATLTTKDRLNAIDNVRIYQKNYQWFLNDKPWDGSWVIVAPDGSWLPEIDIWA